MVSPVIEMLNWEKQSGVSGIPTQLLVLHSGECPLRGGYAQSLTLWASTPLALGGPEASWTWFVDPIAIVNMIDPNYTAWHASEANPMSEGIEQGGYARFTRDEWLTPEGIKQMDNLAWLMAKRAVYNDIPPVWLSTAQITAITSGRDTVTKGFATHRQIDPETRTDPGNGYPYDVLLAKIKAYMSPPPITKVSEMPSYKRVSSVSNHRRLAKGQAWFLKDKTGKVNENYFIHGAGYYDIKLHLQGTDLPTGEFLTVNFFIVPPGGKPSGYYTKRIPGAADGKFKDCAVFGMSVPANYRIEASVTSSKESAYIDVYGADVATWKA